MDAAAYFRAHHEMLVRYLARLSGDHELAEDAAQEAFARLHRSPPRHQDEIRGWLFRVGTNLVWDAKRRSSTRRRLLATRVPGAFLGDQPRRPDDEAHSAEVRGHVRAALDRLHAKERSALLMREEGFSHREIAQAVGTTTGSVGTILARALEKLARELSLDGEDAG